MTKYTFVNITSSKVLLNEKEFLAAGNASRWLQFAALLRERAALTGLQFAYSGFNQLDLVFAGSCPIVHKTHYQFLYASLFREVFGIRERTPRVAEQPMEYIEEALSVMRQVITLNRDLSTGLRLTLAQPNSVLGAALCLREPLSSARWLTDSEPLTPVLNELTYSFSLGTRTRTGMLCASY